MFEKKVTNPVVLQPNQRSWNQWGSYQYYWSLHSLWGFLKTGFFSLLFGINIILRSVQQVGFWIFGVAFGGALLRNVQLKGLKFSVQRIISTFMLETAVGLVDCLLWCIFQIFAYGTCYGTNMYDLDIVQYIYLLFSHIRKKFPNSFYIFLVIFWKSLFGWTVKTGFDELSNDVYVCM